MRSLRNYRAHVRMEQHFRPSLTDPGYDVVTENEYFVEGTAVEWEELSFSVNGSKWGADRPAFPLLQAEKVLSLPLELRLNQDYRYELAGIERDRRDRLLSRALRADDRRRGALSRAPSGSIGGRLRRCGCRRCRRARRRRLSRTRRSTPTRWWREVEGMPIYVLTEQTARQIVLIAGRNLLLEKASQLQRCSQSTTPASPPRARRRGRASASCIATPIRACAISSRRATRAS